MRLGTLGDICNNNDGRLDKIVGQLNLIADIVEAGRDRILSAYDSQLTNRSWAEMELNSALYDMRNFHSNLQLAVNRIQEAGFSPDDYTLEEAVAVLGSSNAHLMLLGKTMWTRAAGSAYVFRPSSAQNPVNLALFNLLNEYDGTHRDFVQNFISNHGTPYEGKPILVDADKVGGEEYLRDYVFKTGDGPHANRFMMFTGLGPLSKGNFKERFAQTPGLIGLIEGGGNDLLYAAEGSAMAEVARIALKGIGPNGGMHCARPKVLLIHESDRSSLYDEIRNQITGIKHGLPSDQSTTVGVMPYKNAFGFLVLAQKALGVSKTKGELIAVGNFEGIKKGPIMTYTNEGNQYDTVLLTHGQGDIPIHLHPEDPSKVYVPTLVIAPDRNPHTGLYEAKGIMNEMFGPGLLILSLKDGREGIEEALGYMNQERQQLTFTFVGNTSTDLYSEISGLMNPKVASFWTNQSLFDPGAYGPDTYWGSGVEGHIQSSAIVYQDASTPEGIRCLRAGPRDFIRDLTTSLNDQIYRKKKRE
jgi:hypothetical protein